MRTRQAIATLQSDNAELRQCLQRLQSSARVLALNVKDNMLVDPALRTTAKVCLEHCQQAQESIDRNR
jgi:hypothetical protein